MKGFRSYELAVEIYQQCQHAKLPGFLKTQLLRAASSVALNLKEARGRSSKADQVRFFHIALGSAREVQSVVDLHPDCLCAETLSKLDRLGGSIYLLIKHARFIPPAGQQPDLR